MLIQLYGNEKENEKKIQISENKVKFKRYLLLISPDT